MDEHLRENGDFWAQDQRSNWTPGQRDKEERLELMNSLGRRQKDFENLVKNC